MRGLPGESFPPALIPAHHPSSEPYPTLATLSSCTSGSWQLAVNKRREGQQQSSPSRLRPRPRLRPPASSCPITRATRGTSTTAADPTTRHNISSTRLSSPVRFLPQANLLSSNPGAGVVCLVRCSVSTRSHHPRAPIRDILHLSALHGHNSHIHLLCAFFGPSFILHFD